ncbi:MAG: sugar phosphate isomerase/epimerase [Chitinophagaceae bacterium]|nr:sugar phosphate isomerase/epimerase [Chitinophagaceae bacterium]
MYRSLFFTGRKIFITMTLGIMITLPVVAQEIGLQLYSFRNQLPGNVPAMLEKISKMGIREVEGGPTYGLQMDEFKALLKKNNLKMICVGADFNELSANPQATIDLAKSYGAKYVMVAWVPHEGAFSIDDAKKAVSVFNTTGKLLKENGISLCYHAHGYEFTPYEGGTLFDYMAQNMDPRYANFEMDVFWVRHPGQDPVALLQKYPKRFPLMHLKDRKPGTVNTQDGHTDVENNVVLGSGDVGIAAIMKVAKKLGVKHYFIEDESSRSLEQVPQSLAYLKSLK